MSFNESEMSEEFHDWLDQCPCQWFRVSNDGHTATYTFIENEKEDDDE